jgi:hypothetical protein
MPDWIRGPLVVSFLLLGLSLGLISAGEFVMYRDGTIISVLDPKTGGLKCHTIDGTQLLAQSLFSLWCLAAAKALFSGFRRTSG